MNQLADQKRIRVLYSIARGLVIIMAISAVLVAALVIINYYQVSKIDLLEMPTLVTLKTQLRNDPGNTLLQEQIRSLNLLARKSYFTNLWQLKTGGYIILASIVLLLLALKIAKAQERKLPDPTDRGIIPDYLNYSRTTQLVISATGLLIVSGALFVALFTPASLYNQLSDEVVSDLDSAIDLNMYWPNFRGPNGLGIAVHTNVPRTWDGKAGSNILWKATVPLPGFSSPIVIQNRLFISGGNKNTREVYCYDNESGELLWTRTVPNMLQPDDYFDFDYVDPSVGFAAPTMATDGRNVYATFATGDVICYSLNGDQVWGRNLGAPDNHYAHSSSLLVYENLCIVQYDNFRKPRLIALDCRNGSIVWETGRETISWASPVLITNAKRVELVVADSKSVAGYDPLTGVEYWRSACLSGEVGPSPAFAAGIIFVANEYAQATALRITDQLAEPEIIWQIEDNLPNTASPVATDEFVLLATSSGLVTMLDASTGQIHWEEYLGSGFNSSPIVVDDVIYLTDLKGTTFIIALEEQFELRATNRLGEEVSTTPAFLDGIIYIRADKHLYCISESNG
ncbi:MAG: PQQ-binding-like beta-propeller repeat protein [Candidatus Marinimicrobia bacterium]|nr:PQQ-binding-like beta-propeller repeat protein [Candidatus Neomarinimicrobiota bacterium]